MERFINILVVDSNLDHIQLLKNCLLGNGNNLIFTDFVGAIEVIQHRDIGILLVNVDERRTNYTDFLTKMSRLSKFRNLNKLVITESIDNAAKYIQENNDGAMEYLLLPLRSNILKAKIETFKSLYFKDLRLIQLLENIFPVNVLRDLNDRGKSSPKRVENGVVLFTDFVGFSQKAVGLSPLSLIRKLEKYFSRFDEICRRYRLEKIKTIGDSYMAIAGVTEVEPLPELRACLAAIEMRNYLETEMELAKALSEDYWEVRIGINNGPLVAGVIGTSKYNFDVWGDTVNVASRAEQESEAGKILITQSMHEAVSQFVDCTYFKKVTIKKRGGTMSMFYLDKIKMEYCLYNEGRVANQDLLKRCQLSHVDFAMMKADIFNRLRSLLPENLMYHDFNHTLQVEKSARRYARLEGLSEYERMLLFTAIYYHDSGFIVRYDDNEQFAIKLAKTHLPRFGYSELEVETICSIIDATKKDVQPKTLLEKIMRDSDLDYLGRADYRIIATRLRGELENQNRFLNEQEWLDYQIAFLENIHCYYTDTAINLRDKGKKIRLNELKRQKALLPSSDRKS